MNRLRNEGRVWFDDLFEGQRTRAELIVTFLALLEMTRLRLTNIHQDNPLSPISIELAVAESEWSAEQDLVAQDVRDVSHPVLSGDDSQLSNLTQSVSESGKEPELR